MKRTPWFNAMNEPPVNGDDDARYEWRCLDLTDGKTEMTSKGNILRYALDCCADCQWRGLLEQPKCD